MGCYYLQRGVYLSLVAAAAATIYCYTHGVVLKTENLYYEQYIRATLKSEPKFFKFS